MNLKDEIKKVMNYLETIDFMDNSKRKENQRRVNKAYLKLEEILRGIENE